MLQRRQLDTRSMYRSVRYRVNRDTQTRTADPSTCNFRIKRNSVLEATMANTVDSGFATKFNTLDVQQFAKTDYLKTFNSMMSCRPKLNARESRQKRQISYFQDSRILLPAFQLNQKQVEESQHSLLTPFMQPYTHVNTMLINSQNQLKSQRATCQQIKYGLKNIKQCKTKQLNDIQNLGKEHFANIRGILRKNQINQQERKLKTKRQLDQLEEKHAQNRKLFTILDEKSSGLQITIFNSTPYNVRHRGDEKGEIYI